MICSTGNHSEAVFEAEYAAAVLSMPASLMSSSSSSSKSFRSGCRGRGGKGGRGERRDDLSHRSNSNAVFNLSMLLVSLVFLHCP